MVDVIVQVPVERRAQRTVEVPQFRKARRVGGVPVTRQGKQIVEVLKRGRLVLVADLGIAVVDGIAQAQMTRRFVAVPGIEVADEIVQVLGVSGAVRLREVMRLARAGARPPLEVLFPVSN